MAHKPSMIIWLLPFLMISPVKASEGPTSDHDCQRQVEAVIIETDKFLRGAMQPIDNSLAKGLYLQKLLAHFESAQYQVQPIEWIDFGDKLRAEGDIHSALMAYLAAQDIAIWENDEKLVVLATKRVFLVRLELEVENNALDNTLSIPDRPL